MLDLTRTFKEKANATRIFFYNFRTLKDTEDEGESFENILSNLKK